MSEINHAAIELLQSFRECDPREQRETFDALGREGRIAEAKEAVCEAAKRVRTLRGKVSAIHAIGYATPWILSDELHNAIEARDAAIDALIKAEGQ